MVGRSIELSSIFSQQGDGRSCEGRCLPLEVPFERQGVRYAQTTNAVNRRSCCGVLFTAWIGLSRLAERQHVVKPRSPRLANDHRIFGEVEDFNQAMIG
jgi:hypothetical protein